MIQIVSIETKMRRKQWRVCLTLSDGQTLEVDADTFAKSDLHTGDAFDDSVQERLMAEDRKQRALQQALRWLAVRPQAAGELHRRLVQKGFGREAGAVVERLREEKYLDDADFARRFVKTRLLSKAVGPKWIEQELKAKGVDAGVAEMVIAEMMNDDQRAALARKAATKKLVGLKKTEPAAKKQKLFRFLMQRGFDADLIGKILKDLGL